MTPEERTELLLAAFFIEQEVTIGPFGRTLLFKRISVAMHECERDALLVAASHLNDAMDDVDRRGGGPLSVADVRRLAHELERMADGLEP